MKHSNTGQASGGTIFSVVIFLSSASIGAGILGLPIQAGSAGLIPVFSAIFFVWLIMLFTSYFIADIYLESSNYDSDIPELLERPLGWFGKVFGTVGYLLNAYGILVAYIAASGSVLQELFSADNLPVWFFSLCFFIPAALATLAGHIIVRKANGIIMFFLFCSFGILLWFAFSHSVPARWRSIDWGYVPVCFPVILTAFVIHNLVPSVCRYLSCDRLAIRKALFWGMMIPFIMNLLWLTGVIGALPLRHGVNSIGTALKLGNPATVPLEGIASSEVVAYAGMIFSITAIFTSFTAIGVGMQAFFRDLVNIPETVRGFCIGIMMIFLPPVVIVLLYPDIFLAALGVVGGIGIVLVYGLMPCFVILKSDRSKKFKAGVLLLIFVFLSIMGFEIVRNC
jgi:tyrosine-specific transport protein